MAVTALLKAPQGHTQGLFHLLPHKEDAMQVVGHHLQGNHLYLVMVSCCRPPFVAHPLSQLR